MVQRLLPFLSCSQVAKIITLYLVLISITVQGQVNPPLIQCVDNPGGTSDLVISWTAPVNGCGPFLSWDIYASTSETGPFNLLTSINNTATLSFTHSNALVSGASWYYYMQPVYDCPGEAVNLSPIASNNIPTTFIDGLQVNGGGVEINWTANSNGAVQGYFVTYADPSSGAPVSPYLADVSGLNTTSFFDSVSNINDPDLSYMLIAYDGCPIPNLSNASEPGFPLMQWISDPTTMVDRCDQIITPEWVPFVYPYASDYGFFQVVEAVINGTDTIRDTIFNPFTPSTNLFGFEDGDIYEIRVLAIDSSGNILSSTPPLNLVTEGVQPPDYFYISYITINSDGHAEIQFAIDPTGEIEDFELLGGDMPSSLDRITYVTDPGEVATLLGLGGGIFIDSTYDANVFIRYFEILADDECPDDAIASTMGRTIRLQGELTDFFEHSLSWNAYELENATVNQCNLFMTIPGQPGEILIDTYTPSTLSATNPLTAYSDAEGTFCYRLSCDYTLNTPNAGPQDFNSTSNTICLDQRPVIHIPNAVAPEGINNEFKPVVVFDNPQNYLMRIYSKWGELIFESRDIDFGWDGRINGESAIAGGYAYQISFDARDGTAIQKTGTVIVVR